MIAHVASPFHFIIKVSHIFHLQSLYFDAYLWVTQDPKRDMIDPAVRGALEILEAAAKAPSVQRVVITGSFAAVHDESKGMNVGTT